jgi:hypothetical protein
MSQFPSSEPAGGKPNPFATSPPGYAQPKSKTWLYVLLGGGGVLLLLCCGCGGMGYFFFNTGMNIVGQELVRQLNADPVAQEHLGTVSSATMDFMATGEATQKRGGNVIVFHVTGDKGSGNVTAEQTPGQQSFQNAELSLPDGNTVKLGF